MLVRSFLCNVYDARALICLCLLVSSQWEQIRDPWDSQVLNIAHIVIGLSLHIHSFIHLSLNQGVGLVISRLLVQFPAGALWSFLGQDSLFHIASVYPAAKWIPSINKAVLRACALFAANCSGISRGGLKWCPCYCIQAN